MLCFYRINDGEYLLSHLYKLHMSLLVPYSNFMNKLNFGLYHNILIVNFLEVIGYMFHSFGVLGF